MKRNTMAFRLTLLTAALITLPALAPAALLTYEGFGDYASDGSVHGLTGGSGWHSGGWDTQNNTTPYQVDSSSPLTFGSLVTSANGRYLNGGNVFTNVGRRLDTGNGSVWHTNGYVSSPFSLQDIDQGGVLWFSILARTDTASRNVEIDFISNNTPWSPGSTDDIRIRTDSGQWQAGTIGGSFTNALAQSANTTTFLVGRFDMNGANSSFHFWATDDPTALALGGPDLVLGTANVALTGLNASNIGFRSLHIYGSGGLGHSQFDEIRFGTTFADVSPIPEPSTYALIGLGLAALFTLRRLSAKSS
jgi:hypothetical protein